MPRPNAITALMPVYGDARLTAHQMGFAAYSQAGLTLAANPFPHGDHERALWRQGWTVARDEHRAYALSDGLGWPA